MLFCQGLAVLLPYHNKLECYPLPIILTYYDTNNCNYKNFYCTAPDVILSMIGHATAIS
jgi:hypothetical protein